ncbi:MAG TPA: serine/threonine-protein kinase, partial [Aggregatilineaceae bacterium]|nr:serine/threonine-protein kinase [Aggregatilineaceae bacterium]
MINDLLGQTLGGRYRFEELLGEGTFAYVFRVYDVQRRVVLAAKVLRRDIAQEPAFLERFKREAAVLSRLQHPHIVRYYDTVELEDVTFILMDYIQGRTLLDILGSAPEPLKPAASLVYLTPLVAALHFAHSEGVIHRDLKPANILISENGTLYVTDFGIARILSDASTLTIGGMVGTPLYMAPEQITGQPVTPATDIYALGVLVYQMVTGELPFRGVSSDAVGSTASERIAYEQVNSQPPRPTRINPSLNPAVEDVILRCLKKEPTRRYPSASDFYDAIAEAIGAPPITLDVPAEKQKFGPVPQRPEKTIPEWSKVIPPVPEPPPDELDTPAQPPTQPHLEKELERHLAEPTIPAIERVPPAPDYGWQQQPAPVPY